jgi:hypothetical protein
LPLKRKPLYREADMRFVKSFLGAWLAALIMFWGALLIAEPANRNGQELLDGLAFFPLYAFGFTLILGLPTWYFLRMNQFDRPWHFAMAGAVVGYLGLAFLNPEPLGLVSTLTVGFVLAGAGAGFVFRSVYGASTDEFAVEPST